MGFEPWRGPDPHAPNNDEELRPADEDVIRALSEIEKASTPLPSATSNTPIHPDSSGIQPRTNFSSFSSKKVAIQAMAISLGAALGLAGMAAHYLTGRMVFNPRWGRTRPSVRTSSALNPALQNEAEQLLQRVAAGDSAAAAQVLDQASNWTGKTRRTPKSEQSMGVTLNLPDLHARSAAVRAELALDGVTLDEAGLKSLESSVHVPSQRLWALWMLGAIGNQGVDPAHAAKIIEAYLADPDVNVRAAAVNGLAIIGTDETIPMMLDRFRNDPSPVVQERAACSLAESGMYTHEQRMVAAGTLVNWLDDSLINAQQRGWTVQALHDISGQSLGPDSAAWRDWYGKAAVTR